MSEEKTIKYTVWDSISRPLMLVGDNSLFFLKLIVVFTLLLTVEAYVFGQTFLCLFNQVKAGSLYCLGTGWIYIVFWVIKFGLIGFYLYFWSQKSFKSDYSQMKKSWLRMMAVMLVFLVLNVLPGVSAFVLLKRVPNPVWQIEALFFTFVGCGFLAPFILMRFYAVLYDLIIGKGAGRWREVWDNTRYQSVKIVFSASVIFVICLIFLIAVNNNVRADSVMSPVWQNLLAEVWFNLAVLLMMTLIFNFVQVQHEMVLGEPKKSS